MVADAEVEMARGHPHEVCVLSSSFFCDGVRCAGLTRELAELQMKRRLDASRSGVGSLSEALAIVKSLKAVLSSEAAELQADPKSLFSVLWNKIDSLALPLKVSRRGGRACFSIRVAPSEVVRRHHTHVPRAEVNKTKKEGDELLARAAEAAEKVKLDVVHGSQLREQLQTLVDSGIAPVLEGGAKKCNEVTYLATCWPTSLGTLLTTVAIQVPPTIRLRACYALSGTHVAYSATRSSVRSICPRTSYALPRYCVLSPHAPATPCSNVLRRIPLYTRDTMPDSAAS
eukprot:874173-Rhodomonas_salina.5